MSRVFSKVDTTIFKGVGILMIVFHNFFHTPPEFGLENEESFNPANIYLFLDYFTQTDPANWIAALSGFLGHYGVQIFILFSAYGLTIQFGKKETSSIKFLLLRLKKIYFLLFFGIVFCVVLYWLQGSPMSLYDIAKKSFLLGSTISSFTTWYLYGMFAGPFWFFALIIQLYVLFPFLYRVVISFDVKMAWIPFVAAYLIIYPLYYLTSDSHLSVFGNIFGHIPEVVLGIAMAHFKFRSFNKFVLSAAFVVFILSQLYEVFFPLSFLAVTILLIHFINFILSGSPNLLKRMLLFTGKISMILFIVNGRFRFLTLFHSFSLETFLYYLPLLFSLSYLLFILYQYLQKKLHI